MTYYDLMGGIFKHLVYKVFQLEQNWLSFNKYREAVVAFYRILRMSGGQEDRGLSVPGMAFMDPLFAL